MRTLWEGIKKYNIIAPNAVGWIIALGCAFERLEAYIVTLPSEVVTFFLYGYMEIEK